MEHSKDIICPDCNLNEISTEQFEKYGRCMGCYRRELVSKAHNRPYIKFVDLPKEEQDRLLALRDKNSKARYNRINNKSTQPKPKGKQCVRASYADNSILHNFLSNSQNLTMNEILDYVKKYIPGCEGITATYLRTLMNRGNYKYRKATPTAISNKEGKLTVNIRCTVYTQEVMNAINTMVTKDMYIADIYETLINMFPNNGITPSNLTTKLRRLNIPYKHGRKSINDTKKDDTTKEPVLEINNEYTITQSETMDTPENVKETNHCINKEDINDEVELRLQPIRQEVEDTLQKQFTQLNCTLEKNYSTHDYIQMLEMLEYLILNKDNIIRVRTNQHDVANAYQQDALHEMENSLAKAGDTYLSDKMHVVRDIRRYYEYDCKDVTILRGLINRIDIKNVQYTKRALLDQVEKREEILYIPMVDMKLIDKHDWATDTINDSPAYKKRILYRNVQGPATKYENTDTPETNDVNKGRKFRVSCKLSGGGYGVFQPWYKDYVTNTRDLALSLAKGELAQLAHTYPGIIYTELNVLEINAK